MPGHLGDRERRGVREAVGVADDELVERVPRVEGGPRRPRASGRERGGGASARRLEPCGRGDELDVDLGPEHGRGAACRSRPKRSATQGAVSSGASSERARRLLAARSGSSHWCQVESGTARRSSARISRQEDECSGSDTDARKGLLGLWRR